MSSSTPTTAATPERAAVQTASFFTYTGVGRISIARFAPRNTPAGYRVFKPLAPGAWFNSVSWDEYQVRYAAEILDPLDPAAVLEELQALAGEGNTPTLLCWEKPPFEGDNHCHRRLVAAWFEQRLGFAVPEIGAPPIAASGATRLKRSQVTLKFGLGSDPAAK